MLMEWMKMNDAWMNELLMNEWTNMDDWMNEWMNGWMDGWMKKCMHEWMNIDWLTDYLNEWMNYFFFSHQGPSPPTNLIFTLVTSTYITVTWDRPSTGGIDSYLVTYTPSSQGSPSSPITVAYNNEVTQTATITNLLESTEYTFSIYSVVASLESEALTRGSGKKKTSKYLYVLIVLHNSYSVTSPFDEVLVHAKIQYCSKHTM